MAHQPCIGVPTTGMRVLEGTQPQSTSPELHVIPDPHYPIPASNWTPDSLGTQHGVHTHLSPLLLGAAQHSIIPSRSCFSLEPCWDVVAHRSQIFPQHQPGIPAALAMPQLPLHTSLSPSCPQPLALTMECCRPLALAPSRSRCLHCPQQLSQDLCQDHCPWCCTCPRAAAWGARGFAACQAVGRSCRSPWRAW